MNKNVVVLGAGISGLATALQIQQAGFNVTVLEKNSAPGGSMRTEKSEGFTIDFGPNSGLETTPVIKELVKLTGMEDEFVYANPVGNKRYILKKGELLPLPMGPGTFLKTKLFSTSAKLRLLAEPFVSKSEDGYYQSISQFVKRRLGQEFLDYAINPFVAGVYAGDPSKLSVKSAFPKLYALEENYGGLIKGMIKGAKERKKRQEESKQSAKMFSFKNGMQSFALAISKMLETIEFNAEVQSVKRNNGGYEIKYLKEREQRILKCDAVVSTAPAYTAAKYLGELSGELANHLKSIYYPPVLVLFAGFKKDSVRRKLDGFGYLIPEKERQNHLGAIWSSAIFENRAPEDMAAFTIFVGGARQPNLFEMERERLINLVLKEFTEAMKIQGKPAFLKSKFWEKAIPQYNIGYVEHEKFFAKFEEENKGLFLSGNYRGGISLGDCVKNSKLVAEKVINYLSK